MALLDVSEVFSDPLFTEIDGTVQFIRGTETADTNGRAKIVWSAPQTIPSAIVQPVTTNLGIDPMLIRVEKAIEVYCNTKLYIQTDTTPGDRILYNGRTYIVKLIVDYSNYGVGYIQAIAEMLETTEEGP